MTRDRTWAWIVPWVAGSILAAFERPLMKGLGQSYSCLLYFVAGMALGWTWYRLYPRQLAMRIFGLTVCLSLGIVLMTVISGGHGEFTLIENPSANDFLPLGVLAGLVLTEGARPGDWKRQKRTALTSRETMRELR
jgi:hypothetical protein